jgi:hypothetical protein
MAELIADCPRCGSRRITFDVTDAHTFAESYGWKRHYEAFSVCRNCRRTTIFVLSDSVDRDYEHVHKQGLLNLKKSLNNYVDIDDYVSIKHEATVAPPEHVPEDIEAAFREGATCAAVGCPNAAGTMFRLCIDLATRPMLPEGEAEGLTWKVRRDLGLRLPWLFKTGRLDRSLEDLSSCIKEDGNDGAHAGTLSPEDAADLLDFAVELLERLYTEKRRLELAKERREARREKGG